MGKLSNYVSMDIIVNSVSAQRAGFGVQMILSYNATFPQRTRVYSDLAAVAEDFPTTTGPEYLAAQAAFAQEPAPDKIKIGRGVLKPTQKYELAATVDDSFDYKLDIAGDGVTATTAEYTSSSTETDDTTLGKAKIHNGLISDLNAVVGKNFTAAFAALTFADDTFTAFIPLVYADKTFTADNATETFTAVAHGLQTGDGPFQVSNSGGALPTGLTVLTNYWIIRVTADTFKLATSLAFARAGTNLSISSDGTGTQTISDVATTATFQAGVMTDVAHGLKTGDGPFQLSSSSALPSGLATLTDYWIIRVGADTFKLATSLALALAGTAVDLTDAGSGTQTISDTVTTARPSDPFTVTADAAGEWFSLSSRDIDRLSNVQTHLDPGVATDLIAIAKEDPDWYGLITLYNSKAYAVPAADWVESNGRLYLAESCDSSACTVAVGGGNNDLLEVIKTSAYKRTGGLYHPTPSEMFAVALFGKTLSQDAGQVTFALKSLSTVDPVILTDNHRENLVDRRATSYEEVAGLNVTFGGEVGDPATGYLDIKRDLDWQQDDITKSVFEYMVRNSKVPGSDGGIQGAGAELRSSLKRGQDRTIIARDPDFDITLPKQSARSSADKNARRLTGMKFKATLVGAIHEVDILGTVST